MTRHARYAYGFIVVMLMVVLSFAGIGPVNAQQDQPTQTPGAADQNQQNQGNNNVTLQANDTLGSILGGFPLTEEQVRQFLVANADLSLGANQTVVFPAGVQLQDVSGTGEQAGGAGSAQATPTATASGAGAGTQATPTTTAGSTNGQGAAQENFVCASGQANPGDTYNTQSEDTLGQLLTIMGLDVQAERAAGGNVDQGGQQGQVTTNQVVQFVYLNCGLRFDTASAQTVVVPAGIPQTGAGQQGGQANQQATPTATAQQGGQGQQATPTATTQQGGQQGSVPQTGAQAQQNQGTARSQLCHPYADPENLRYLAIYVVRGGDTLTSIARRFGTDVEDLLSRNPHIRDANIIFTGQWILLHPGERPVINALNWQQACNNTQNR